IPKDYARGHSEATLFVCARGRGACLLLALVSCGAAPSRQQLGGEVDRTYHGHHGNDVNDPGCVKTHTSAKCRKSNSPTRYRAESAQDDLAPLCAISPRCFYVRGARWSFHTAKTHTGLHLQCRPAAPVAGQSVGLASRQERKRQLPGLLGKASTAFARRPAMALGVGVVQRIRAGLLPSIGVRALLPFSRTALPRVRPAFVSSP